MRRWSIPAVIVVATLVLASLVTAHDQPKGGGFAIEGPFEASGSTACTGGFAGTFPCSNVDLLAYVPHGMLGGTNGNDIWGWTDPITNREYALVGERSGTAFVDITTPTAPVYLGFLPTQTFASTWRDIKTYANHAFIVSEASSHGMQVFDLTNLRNVASPPVTFSPTAHYSGFSNSHNIAINEDSGFAYAVGTNTCFGGLHMVNITNPTNPTSAGCGPNDGYTHDTQCVVYDGPDSQHAGKEICFSANEDTLTVINVTNKSQPVQLSRTGYSGYGYMHQGWLTENHRYFLADDESDETNFRHNTRTYVWDVTNLDAPFMVGFYEASTAAIDHNQYVLGDFVYQANYRAGLRIAHLGNLSLAQLSQVGYFDIYPADDNRAFNGAWSVYPYFDSGVVIVNGIEQGLFVLQPNVDTPGPTHTPTSTPMNTATRTPTSTPTTTPTRTPTSLPTSTPTRTPTSTPTSTPTRTPTGTPTSSPTPNGALSGTIVYSGSGVAIDAVEVALQGPANALVQTDGAGDFAANGLALGSWLAQPGKDGAEGDAIDAGDALYALEAAVGTQVLDGEQTVACDVTGNGGVGGLDASMILQYAVDSLAEFPVVAACGSPWIFFPHPVGGSGQPTAPQITASSCTAGSITYAPLAGAVEQQNFSGVLAGDCDRSWNGGGGGALRAAQPAVTLGRARLGRGRLIEVPVQVAAGIDFRALTLVVRYDPIYLRAADVRSLAGARGAMLRTNTKRPGFVRLALARLQPIAAGDRPVLLLRFAAEGRKRSVALRRAQHMTISRQRVE